jgi:TadE-like protein
VVSMISRVGIVRRYTPRRRRARGQALAEFALVSFVLFALMLAILELGWFMFVYSVVSNSAQEGSRYGIAQPRHLFSEDAAAEYALRTGTDVPSWAIVPNGVCNVVDKARSKVQGVPRNQVNIDIWYDLGDGNAIPIPGNDLEFADTVAKGNRIVVEASYRHHFVMPFFDSLAPSGLDVRMRAARTMQRTFDIRDPNDDFCVMGSSHVPRLRYSN